MPARQITTEMWSDPTVAELSPPAILIWVRLITGPETTCAGTTRVLGRTLAAETNQDRPTVDAAVQELLDAGLVERHGEALWMPGWIDHQVSGRGMLIAARREAARRDMPAELAARIRGALDERFGPPPASAQESPRRRAGSRQAADRLPEASRQGPDRVAAGTGDYSGPPSLREEGGLSAAAPAPAPGAQTPPRGFDDIDIAEEERQHTGAVALAEVAETATHAEIGRILAAHAQQMAQPAPLPDIEAPEPEPAFTGHIDQEQPEPSGLRRWEAAELVAWDRTADPAHLAEIERSGSPPARAAAAQLLRDEAKP